MSHSSTSDPEHPAPQSLVDNKGLIQGAEQQVGAGEQVETPAADARHPRAAKDAELDDALDDSFPASDPPSPATKGRVK
jgi:hypothetical protein